MASFLPKDGLLAIGKGETLIGGGPNDTNVYFIESILPEGYYVSDEIPELNKDLLQSYPDIKRYTKYYDECINMGLRNNKLSTVCYNILRQIYNVLDRSVPYPPGLVLFRGIVSTEKFRAEDWQIGQIVEDPGLMSKSVSSEEAFDFSGKCCFLVMRYPGPSKQLDLSEISEFKKEKEFLSYPGERFIVREKGLIWSIRKTNSVLFVLDYIGNMYTNPQMIVQKIDYQIDNLYPRFINCLRQYITLPYQDAPNNAAIFFEDVSNGPILTYLPKQPYRLAGIEIPLLSINTKNEKTIKNINDRLYTIFASGRIRNVYALPDIKFVMLVRNSFTISDFTFGPFTVNFTRDIPPYDQEFLDTYYAKGEIKSIINDETGEVVIPRRIKITCMEELYNRLSSNI